MKKDQKSYENKQNNQEKEDTNTGFFDEIDEETIEENEEEDQEWFEEDKELDMVIDAKDLMYDYFLAYPHIKKYLEEGEHLPREIEVRIRRAYALLQAYLSEEKGISSLKVDQEMTVAEALFGAQIKAKELYKFFSFEKVSKLPKISKAEIAEAMDLIKDIGMSSYDYEKVSQYCKDLRLKAFRLENLRKLMCLRLEADQILDPLTQIISSSFTDRKEGDLQFQVYLDLYNSPVKKANSTLTKIIITLMGSVFKKTFTKQELMENFGFPSATEEDLYDLHVLDMWKKNHF